MILVLAVGMLLGGWGSTLALITAAVLVCSPAQLVGACVEMRPGRARRSARHGLGDHGIDQAVRAAVGDVAFGEPGGGRGWAEVWRRDRRCERLDAVGVDVDRGEEVEGVLAPGNSTYTTGFAEVLQTITRGQAGGWPALTKRPPKLDSSWRDERTRLSSTQGGHAARMRCYSATGRSNCPLRMRAERDRARLHQHHHNKARTTS